MNLRQLVAPVERRRVALDHAVSGLDRERRASRISISRCRWGVLALEGEPAEIRPALLRREGSRRAHRSDWPTPQTRAIQAKFGDALTTFDTQKTLRRRVW